MVAASTTSITRGGELMLETDSDPPPYIHLATSVPRLAHRPRHKFSPLHPSHTRFRSSESTSPCLDSQQQVVISVKIIFIHYVNYTTPFQDYATQIKFNPTWLKIHKAKASYGMFKKRRVHFKSLHKCARKLPPKVPSNSCPEPQTLPSPSIP